MTTTIRKHSSSNLMFGKIPPQAKEMEEAVLGAIMLEKHAYNKASSILSTHECFYVEAHQMIYKAMMQLTNNRQPIDITTVVEQLLKTGDLDKVGGPWYVTKLTNDVASSAHIESHCNTILQKFTRRELIRISGELLADAYDDTADYDELLERAEKSISHIILSSAEVDYITIRESADTLLNKIEGLRGNEQQLTGVDTGNARLNQITGGWQKTNLIILSARPSIGKSAVAGNLATAASKSGTKAGIFSLEMSHSQWTARILAAESDVDLWNITMAKVDDTQMNKLHTSAGVLGKLGIFIDDTAGLTITKLKSKARKMVLQEGVGLLVIDYLQLIVPSSNKIIREQQVADVSRNLKLLAKELKVPIIALSQLSRGADGVEAKLSDLRESGAIEQDADDVIFIDTPSEQDIQRDAALKDDITLRIAKHRNGPLAKVPAKFVRSIQKIMSESEYDTYMHLKTVNTNGTWRPVREYE